MTGAYSYQIAGPPLPPDVTGFTVNQVKENVVMSWDDISDPGIVGFDVFWGTQDQGFSAATVLTEITRATEITTAKIPPGEWTFWIVARDIADQTSLNPASFVFTVENYNTVLFQKTFIPQFADVGSGSVKHWTGKIMSVGQFSCDTYVQISPPDLSVVTLDYVAGGDFEDTTYYFTFTWSTEGGETLPSLETSILVPAGNLPTTFIAAADFSTAAVNGYNVYCDPVSGSETKQNISPLGGPVIINGERSPTSDQVWQMPQTGLVAGAAQPTQNTTGWEVFNVFIPNAEVQMVYIPPFDYVAGNYSEIDTLVQANKRVWLTCEIIPGPGQLATSGVVQPNLNISSAPIVPFPGPDIINNFVIGIVEDRYLSPELLMFSNPGYVCYLNNLQITVDNSVATSALNGVSVSSAGTAISFSDYGLAYHQTPNIQVTSASSAATSGNAAGTTSTGTTITLYNGGTAVTGLANITLTGV